MNEQQITELLWRFYAGDQKALEELYQLTGKFAFFHARTMVRQDEEAWKFVEIFYTDLYKAQAIPASEALNQLPPLQKTAVWGF